MFDREAAVEEIALRVKRFSVKSFMDAWTLNVERLQQCCVHVGSTDGEANPVRVPFCARQLFGGLRAHDVGRHGPGARARPARRRARPARGGAVVSAVARSVRGPSARARTSARRSSRPEKYERLAFTFCRMGTVGLIAWARRAGRFRARRRDRGDRPVRQVDHAGRRRWTKCFLRRPTLIIGVLGGVAVVDAYWIFVLGSDPAALDAFDPPGTLG